jgi:hypothetical protein
MDVISFPEMNLLHVSRSLKREKKGCLSAALMIPELISFYDAYCIIVRIRDIEIRSVSRYSLR